MDNIIKILNELKQICETSNQRKCFNELVKAFGVDSNFNFDFTTDKDTDILELTNHIYESTKFDSVYWFGYQFKSWVDSNTRTKLIHYIRGISEKEFNDKDKREFIEKPLIELSKESRIRDIEFVIYPESKRSDLNIAQGKVVTKYFRSKPILITLIKNDIRKVEFDYERYRLDNSNKFPTEKMWLSAKKSIDDMMEKIHNLEYFHIAAEKPKYRNYFRNYLIFKDQSVDLTKFKQGMILDDIATTGATLDNIISMIKFINPDIKLFIYSIIGKP